MRVTSSQTVENSLIKSFNLIYHDARIWQIPNEGGVIVREEATERTYVLPYRDGANGQPLCTLHLLKFKYCYRGALSRISL